MIQKKDQDLHSNINNWREREREREKEILKKREKKKSKQARPIRSWDHAFVYIKKKVNQGKKKKKREKDIIPCNYVRDNEKTMLDDKQKYPAVLYRPSNFVCMYTCS